MPKHVTKQLASYTVVFEYHKEDNGYLVTVPSLPGCLTWGKTLREAKAHAREAIQGFIEALQKEGKPVPVDRTNTRLRVRKKLSVRV